MNSVFLPAPEGDFFPQIMHDFGNRHKSWSQIVKVKNDCVGNALFKNELQRPWNVSLSDMKLPQGSSPLSFQQRTLNQGWRQGRARGGLGGYSPPSEHASPPSEGEKGFFGDFWHL